MKKTIYLLCLMALAFSLAGKASAEETPENPKTDMPVNEINGPPLVADIKSVNFNEEAREISLTVGIKNNSGTFIDNVNYVIELYKGDKLASEGMLFQGLEYIVSDEQAVGAMAVNESTEKTFKYIPPIGIESGNYFIRFLLSDKETAFFGIDYTPEPINLSGQGGFLGYVRMDFRTSYGDNRAMSGMATNKGEKVALIFPLDEKENSKLAQKLSAGDELSAGIKIYSLAMNRKLVKDLGSQKLKASKEEKDGKTKNIVKIDLSPWEGMQAGPYDVVVSILDNSGKNLSGDVYARWLISGFAPRIRKVSSQTNLYQKNEPIDLSAEIYTLGIKESQKIATEVILNGNDPKQSVSLKKEFDLVNGENNLSFSDLRLAKKLEVKLLDLIIKDANTGEVLDSYQMTFAPINVPKTNFFENWPKLILIMIIVLTFFLSLFLIIKKKINNRNAPVGIFLIIFLLIVVGWLWLGGTEKADAACKCNCSQAWSDWWNYCPSIYGCPFGAASSMSVWFDQAPTGGGCPRNVTAVAYARVDCNDCINGMDGRLTLTGFPNGDASLYLWGDGGHSSGFNSRYQIFGPVTKSYDISAGQSFSYRAIAYMNDGCWCPGSSAQTSWRNVSASSCAVNGACSATHYNCSSGTLGATAEYADQWQWWCNGSGGGTNILCSEAKPIPVVNGACSATHYNCSSGTLGATAEYADQWQWWCNGSGGGTNIICSEMKPTVPADPVISPSCPSPGTAGNVSWSAVPGATYYAFRLNNETLSGWDGSCDPANGLGDICENISAPTTSRNFVGSPGSNYTAWIHACNAHGCSPAGNGRSFSCIPSAPTLTLTADTPIDKGDSSTLTWTTSNAAYCWASNSSWSGWKTNTGGTEEVSPDQTTTYKIKCSNIANVESNEAEATVCVSDCNKDDQYCQGATYTGNCGQTCTGNAPKNWSNWSDCNVSCGGGSKNRSLTCIGVTPSIETQACNSHPCPPGYREVAPW